MPDPIPTPVTQALTQDVYTGVTERQRPALVGGLWASGAIRVEVVKTGDTYTVTATFKAE